MTAAQAPDAVDQGALAVLDLALRATEAYERPDLARRLTRVRERITDPKVRVLVVGEFKQGKSSLVNALVNATVCPIDDDVATAVPTAVHYADTPVAVALHAPDDPLGEPRREPVEIDDTAAYVSEAGNPGNERNLWAFEIGLPRPLLKSGLVLVDTPGVGGLGSAHSATTISALPSADAVLLCTDASQELTEPELAFLEMTRDLCPTIGCVLTKTDFYPLWREVAELDRRHLADRGMDAPVLTTSASLRLVAADRNDRDLNHESGYPHLLAFLRQRVLGNAGGIARRAAAHAVARVAEQLEARFTAERAALADPHRSAELVSDLEEAQARAAELRDRAARWQQTLSDGVTDLVADADYDLRERMRGVIKQFEAVIPETDPGKVWDDLEQWLYRLVTTQVAANYALVTSRAEELAGEVAQHFAAQESAAVAGFGVDAPLERLRQIARAPAVDHGRTGVGAKGLIAMRGSYGGVMMIGIIGSVMGFGLLNPVSLGFGVILGRKAIRDERERALNQRRQQARQACRAYVDEVSFTVGKDARDGLRRLQRALRDTFTEQAEELQRSTGDALQAAKSALRASEVERKRRLADVDAELHRIRGLAEQGRNLG